MSTIVDVTPVAIAAFDYGQLTAEIRPKIEQITRELKDLIQQDAFTRCKIGQRLLEVKDMLPHGQWLGWLEQEFPWSDRQAQYLMQAAKKFGDQIRTGFVFETKALRLLSGDSVPDEARSDAIAIAEAGQTVTTPDAEALINKYAPPVPQPEINQNLIFTPSVSPEIPQDSRENIEERSPTTYLQAAPPTKKTSKQSELQGLQDINAIEQIRIDELEKLVKGLDDLLQQVVGWCGDSLTGDMVGEAAKLHRDRVEMIG